MAALTAGRSLVAAILAGIGASLCCVAPLVLLTLGIGGAWIGSLTALEPYRPVFIGVTVLFFGIAFRELYLAPLACAAGGSCSDSLTLRRQRVVFWVASILTLTLLAVPWVAPLFY
jgi:mercuric ion transport protein